MKKNSFSLNTFILATIVLLASSFLTFICAFAEDEGTGNALTLFFSKFYMVLRFPTHTLFWSTFNQGSLFLCGLLFNALFYGLIVERVISLIRQSKEQRN